MSDVSITKNLYDEERKKVENLTKENARMKVRLEHERKYHVILAVRTRQSVTYFHSEYETGHLFLTNILPKSRKNTFFHIFLKHYE